MENKKETATIVELIEQLRSISQQLSDRVGIRSIYIDMFSDIDIRINGGAFISDDYQEVQDYDPIEGYEYTLYECTTPLFTHVTWG